MLEIFHIQITWVIFQQFIRRDLKPVALPWLSLLEFSLLLPYSNLHKKTGIRFFSKKLLQKYLFKIPLWDKVMTPLLILTMSSENLKWKQHFHTVTFRNCLLLNMAVWRSYILRAKNLRQTILRNEGLLSLLTWVFIDLMIRGFELVTCRFELVTRGFELVTRGFELVTRGL